MAAPAPMLKPNSVRHRDGSEYYLGNLPGTLQYQKTKEELMTISNIDHKDSTCGFAPVPATPELLPRFIPDTPKGRAGDWQLLVVFASTGELGETWMKGAMLNRKTGKIALMTSVDGEQHIIRNGGRALKSHAEGWAVGFYRMGAPMCFWQAVAAAVAELP